MTLFALVYLNGETLTSLFHHRIITNERSDSHLAGPLGVSLMDQLRQALTCDKLIGQAQQGWNGTLVVISTRHTSNRALGKPVVVVVFVDVVSTTHKLWRLLCVLIHPSIWLASPPACSFAHPRHLYASAHSNLRALQQATAGIIEEHTLN